MPVAKYVRASFRVESWQGEPRSCSDDWMLCAGGRQEKAADVVGEAACPSPFWEVVNSEHQVNRSARVPQPLLKTH